ncbi:unnamed protein product [Peniophora sp. CBMAI 1063]|nr:unnamed protein product [Peniophora sp. CBMAI 1063]
MTYNVTRENKALLERHRNAPPSLSVQLHHDHWTLNSGSKFLYTSPAAAFLDDIRAYRIPVDLLPLIDSAGVPFYEGCLVVELQDFREPPSNKDKKGDEVKVKTEGGPVSSRVVLRSNSESSWADLRLLNDKLDNKWTDQEALEVEAKILVATAPPLCLNPDPNLGRMANTMQRVSTPRTPPPLRPQKRKLEATEADERAAARKVKIAQYMDPTRTRTNKPSQHFWDTIARIRAEAKTRKDQSDQQPATEGDAAGVATEQMSPPQPPATPAHIGADPVQNSTPVKSEAARSETGTPAPAPLPPTRATPQAAAAAALQAANRQNTPRPGSTVQNPAAAAYAAAQAQQAAAAVQAVHAAAISRPATQAPPAAAGATPAFDMPKLTPQQVHQLQAAARQQLSMRYNARLPQFRLLLEKKSSGQTLNQEENQVLDFCNRWQRAESILTDAGKSGDPAQIADAQKQCQLLIGNHVNAQMKTILLTQMARKQALAQGQGQGGQKQAQGAQAHGGQTPAPAPPAQPVAPPPAPTPAPSATPVMAHPQAPQAHPQPNQAQLLQAHAAHLAAAQMAVQAQAAQAHAHAPTQPPQPLTNAQQQQQWAYVRSLQQQQQHQHQQAVQAQAHLLAAQNHAGTPAQAHAQLPNAGGMAPSPMFAAARPAAQPGASQRLDPSQATEVVIDRLIEGFSILVGGAASRQNFHTVCKDMPALAAAPAPSAADLKATPSPAVEGLLVADKAARASAVESFVALVEKDGPAAIKSSNFTAGVIKALGDKKSPAAREAAADAVRAISESSAVKSLEPFFIDSGVYAALLDGFADKTPAARTAAVAAVKAFVKNSNPWAAGLVLPALLHEIQTAGKWQIKTGSLEILDQLVASAAAQIAKLTPEIVPILADAIWDTKADVKKAARASLTKVTSLVSNKDIEKFIPALINALINPVEEVPKTIQLLSATTFVSEVDSPTLSLMVPLLSRGLSEKLTATKRKVAVIVDNMAKLVDSHITVRPFIPKLLPGLLKVEQTIGDPEARSVVGRAIATLRQVGQIPDDQDGTDLPHLKVATEQQLAHSLIEIYKKAGGNPIPSVADDVTIYVSRLATNATNQKNFDVPEWDTFAPYLAFLSAVPEPITVAREWVVKSATEDADVGEVLDDEEEGEDLCNCQFSLAYGAKILLNTATLRLKRGHRYGLCGKNGTGKSTLMRAITNGQVEGFPSPDEVRTFYVEHDIDGSEEDTSVLEFILQDKRVIVSKEEIVETLASVGFTDERQKHAIGSLSGGWKMKLALARAMLFKADILLLDEPTNHLDVVNVAWLENYLTGLSHCTSIIVSHDSGFLNNTITDVLHLNRFKLRRYRGNLEAFVKAVPEAKSYYTLEAAEDYKFKLPDPPFLDGVKTKEKALLKMRKVGFQYPTQPVQQLYDISLQVSLSSRVAVLGPNGSGKSTLVKLLTGEMEPNKGGEVWKHPNLVIGYVAQHAFHHIDQHLDKTPLEYMLWRYQTGEDLEEMMKANRQISEEEQQKMKEGANVVVEGQKRVIDEIVARKKLKQSYEYEITFKGMSSSENIWMPRDELIKRGFEKKVLEVDTREAQRLGLLRPLVRREIEKHMADFGLEPEFVSHNTMRGLSGGQKVKIVLGAATWRRPHIICLDEPTNYLDRESLAALIEALKTFEGGVLVITHNRDFSESICTEVWAMRDGHLEASGHNWVEGQGSGARLDTKAGEEEDQYDAMGNKIDKAKKAKKLTSAEARKAKKDRMARRKRGEEVFTDEEL